MTTRRGFSLIEIMVAIAIFGFFMMGLAKVNYFIAQRFYTLSGGSSRDAEIAGQVNEFDALPFDSLANRVGTKSFSTEPWGFTRVVTMLSTSSTLDSIRLVFTPTNSTFLPDTEVLVRTTPSSNPF